MKAQPGAAPDQRTQAEERRVVWLLWLTYGAFYFCRTNLAAAIPGMERSVAEGGLGLTSAEIGTILASLKLTYGLGQFVNGQLAERLSPRRMLALGMFGSAALNVAFGFSTGFYFLLFVWASNGFFQSMGWAPCVRVAGNWIPVAGRGKAIGVIGTGYQVTLGLTYFVAGQSAELLGWRGALYVPAAMLAAVGLVMLLFLRDAPDEDAAGVVTGRGRGGPRLSLGKTLWVTFTNPALWLLGASLSLLNACRYGFIDWGISHLVDVRQLGVGAAALEYVVLAAGAVAGSYLAGWATDRYFGSRRAPVICILLVSLSVLTLVYEAVAQVSAVGTVFLLMAIGFCIFGPQVLLVGTAPADLARHGTTAAAAGFVNFMGYMGAALGDKVTGHYKMDEHGGWQVAIYIWAAWALLAAVFAAFLWNATANADTAENANQ
jgi:MFS transporter, OPA family, glycerol-3-phosphate transporter